MSNSRHGQQRPPRRLGFPALNSRRLRGATPGQPAAGSSSVEALPQRQQRPVRRRHADFRVDPNHPSHTAATPLTAGRSPTPAPLQSVAAGSSWPQGQQQTRQRRQSTPNLNQQRTPVQSSDLPRSGLDTQSTTAQHPGRPPPHPVIHLRPTPAQPPPVPRARRYSDPDSICFRDPPPPYSP